ncbi:MAG: DHA2 family efflux MFS transporter permease subunit [Alphaproteobacteria bacterium]|nr:DHA2 family efflux MFS transporter permease subunit [Alphaproteobacteria bacterium]MBU0798969.1 DHA2 family efflux MFS transporter permease subunit [Alphaproteobacteria bacterium]MBU0887224.1 DHA2 family efflux MFS transporter permease subunit [Alphaproteobacteria bacterium]MBU1812248.1 DHA2 family efflux MFS transporter permease subunit [Alphaproteobacteria bacterium]
MSAESPAAPPVERPMPPLKVQIGFFAMVIGMFMAILDVQIVASSLGEIQAGLSASIEEISWVQTSYLIAEVIMIPLSGTLARIMSTRVLFALGALGFTVMSLACAMANSIETMILARSLQGFFGGAMIPTVFATAYTIYPRRHMARISVMIGLTATMGPTIGPTLGGYITQTLGWHWLFSINLVPGLIVAATVWNFLDVDRAEPAYLRGLDLIGLALLTVSLGSLQYMLEEGPRQDWFDDDRIVHLALISCASGLLFLYRVFTYRQPIIDLRAFSDRNFTLGCIYSFVVGIGLYGSVYMTPLFLAQVREYNAMQIGVIMMVTGLFQLGMAPIAGMLSTRLDLRVMLSFGFLMFCYALYLNSHLTAQSSYWELFVPQAVRGVSLMFCFIPVNRLALGTLPPDKLKNGSSLYNLMRNLGGAMGLATINTLLQDRTALHLARLTDHLSLSRPEVQAPIDRLAERFADSIAGDPELAAMRQIFRLVQREALVMGFNDCLLLLGLTFAASLILMPLVRKPRSLGD